MAFSEEWEKQYQNNSQMSIWPWSDMVSYVFRYTDIRKKKYKVLELGCGAGANIPLFASLGADYYGIDGSQTIVKVLKERFPQYRDNIVCADFTNDIHFKEKFDLIIDRASITHNSTEGIIKILDNVYNKLKSGSAFIGIDWFSTKHDDYLLGEEIDKYTRKNNGHFSELGQVHFSDEEHLKELFKKFKIEHLEEKISTEVLPSKHIASCWNILARKKAD